MNNDAYAAALAEIEEGRLDKGVWARSFADSGGDESKAKALYIKARAESIQSAAVWQDTRPPAADDAGAATAGVKVDSEGSVAQGIDGAKKTPDTSPASPYEAAIGERNQSYYLSKFEGFDEQGPGLHASWNWAAFFGGGVWALYRKMYGWFFVWWAVATVVTIFSKVPEAQIQQGLSVLVLVSWVGFSAFANSLYHRKIKARIAAAQKSSADASRVSRSLRASSGVLIWVPIVFAGIPVIGIMAAVALPAYWDYAKRQASPIVYGENDKIATSPVAPAVEHGPWEDEYQKNSSATQARTGQTADKLPELDLSQFTPENQRRIALEAISRGDYANAAQIYGALASQGDAFSQAKLGYMYANGQGVVQDNVRAHMWSNLSAVAGYALAATNRETFAMQMTPQQIAQAEQMARDCQQRNLKGCD